MNGLARILGISLVLPLLLAAGCAEIETPATTSVPPPVTAVPPPTTLSTTTTTTTLPAPPPVPPGSTPVRAQLEWVLSVMNGDVYTRAEKLGRFSEEFRSQLTELELLDYLDFLAVDRFVVVSVVETLVETRSWAVVLLAASDLDIIIELTIAVEEEAPHRIEGLFVQPSARLDAIPETFADIAAQLGGLANRSTYLTAEVVGDVCLPVHAAGGDDLIALASVFKLYVLGALADAIVAGDVTWDDLVPIRADLKSLPSGTMQEEPDGATFSVWEYAYRMIQFSDNTATDHLIDLLGRQRVEAAFGVLGHHDPGLNTPLLLTRDWFLIKRGLDDAAVEAYLALGPDERRTFLEGELARRSVDDLDAFTFPEPRFVDGIEWFATANDICRVLAGLWGRAAQPELGDLYGIMAAGLQDLDPATWPYIGFKGGSEPGVRVLAYVAERADGRVFVQVLGLADPFDYLDDRLASLLAIEGFRLLGATE